MNTLSNKTIFIIVFIIIVVIAGIVVFRKQPATMLEEAPNIFDTPATSNPLEDVTDNPLEKVKTNPFE